MTLVEAAERFLGPRPSPGRPRGQLAIDPRGIGLRCGHAPSLRHRPSTFKPERPAIESVTSTASSP